MFVDRADGKILLLLIVINANLLMVKFLQPLTPSAFKVVAYGDSLDWKDYGVKDIVKRCTQNKNLGNGSILLLHSGTKYTSEALEKIITGLKDQGYELVPVSELIYREGFKIDHTGRQYKK